MGSNNNPHENPGTLILIPVYNDWTSLALLLPRLEAALSSAGRNADVLVIDDGSTQEMDADFPEGPWSALGHVRVLKLRRNLGHQRAIAVGLAYVEDLLKPAAVVVMDGDGEDDPNDVPRLLERMEFEGNRLIVFAERTRRSESFAFRLGYQGYRLLHRLLTGIAVRVGNFSAIPSDRLASLVVVSELWNHYAAAAFRSRQPFCTIPTNRSRRLHGQTKMNYVGLVTHGLSAISVFGDIVGVRLLGFAMLLATLAAVGLVAAVVIRLATNLAIPGWATFAVGLCLILLIQSFLLMFVFSFVTLAGRQGSSFLPSRDYPYFVSGVHSLGQRHGGTHGI